MKQEELNKLEIEKIEAIHDLTAEVRSLNDNLVEATHALLDSIAKLNHIQLQASSKLISKPSIPPLNLKEAIFPEFATWQRDAINTKSGLVFAPSDLYISNKDGVRRYYFTWDEAMQIEQQILRPCGWRLPTSDEWITTIKEFRTLDRLTEGLKLTANGFVPREAMKKYRKDPGDTRSSLRGPYGFYWSSTVNPSNSNCAYVLYFSEDGEYVNPGTGSNSKYYGLAVRCVKDT